MCIEIRFYVMSHLMTKTIMIQAIAAVFLFGTVAAAPDAYSASNVTICHIPSENSDNAKTIQINDNALSAHLAHGDTEGACPDDIVFNSNDLSPSSVVGGHGGPIDKTALMVTGAQLNASWMIPAIVSAIGIGIVIARKI